MPIDKEKIKQAIRLFLEGIGEDPDREGLLETPERVARMWEEFERQRDFDFKLFEEFGSYNEMVLVKDVNIYSLCEHHLLPFFGKAHIAYIPDGIVCGLSKLVRTVRAFALRPQVQERLTNQIADFLMEQLKPKGVAVVLEMEHLCMSMRGEYREELKKATNEKSVVPIEQLNKNLFRSSLKSELYSALNSVFNYTFGYMVVALVIFYGSYRITEGSLTPGDFLSYLTALVFLQDPLIGAQKGIMELRSALPVINRIRELLNLEEEREGNLRLESFKSDIRVENLWVNLGEEKLLKGINLKIAKGEKLGIMGDTGSGKSTFLRVLAGLLPYQGNIRLDGFELNQIRKEDLREIILLLSQEPFVFPGTVRENLIMAKEKPEEDLWKALKLAGCDFVKSLDQQVSPKRLSGGERQRLALARVFLKSPDIILLDEATSALDAKKEEEVLNNLFENFKDKTFILVAHRFSNLLRCHRVVVLKEGRVVFDGKPKEAIEFFLQSP